MRDGSYGDSLRPWVGGGIHGARNLDRPRSSREVRDSKHSGQFAFPAIDQTISFFQRAMKIAVPDIRQLLLQHLSERISVVKACIHLEQGGECGSLLAQ